MDTRIHKIDRLLQYILAVAGQEDYPNRELGEIHLVKYVYLADLAYAKYHNGETYTGLAWKFHHFGPWSAECYRRIEPALKAIGAEKKIVESAKHADFVRWHTDDYELFEGLDDEMDLGVAGTVKSSVRKFGSDTYVLLDFVYKTGPMLKAAPEELLDFRHAIAGGEAVEEEKPPPALSDRKKKKRRQVLAAYKERLNRRLEERIRERKEAVCSLPPEYDDVFFEGLSRLEEESEVPLAEGEYFVRFSEDIWKSKARHDPDLS